MDTYQEQREWIDTLHAIRTSDHEISYYNEFASDYDRLNDSTRYHAPADLSKAVLDFEKLSGIKCEGFDQFKIGVKIPRDGKILDVGAGTGQAGLVLKDAMKFTGSMDALEPSSEMWAIAKQKGIYSKHYNEPLLENQVSGLPSDEYDFVFSVGCFNNRSMKARCLKELIRTVKKGCYVATVFNRTYFDEAFGAYMHELADAGVIEIKVEKMLDQYINDFVGAAVVLKKI